MWRTATSALAASIAITSAAPAAAAGLAGRDLAVTELHATDSAYPTGSVGVLAIVYNLGDADASSITIKIFLSGDAACTQPDAGPTLHYASLTYLAPGAFDFVAVSPQLPPRTPGGHAFICAVVDDLNPVPEGNEENNVRSEPIEIRLPDGAITGLDVPDVIGFLTPFEVTYSWANLTSVPFGGRAHFSLSADPVCSADDFAFVDEGPLFEPTVTITLTLRERLPAGQYHLCAILDPQDQVLELNEANNTFPRAVHLVDVNLRVNGNDEIEAPSSGPYRLTLTMTGTTFTQPLDWYWLLVVNETQYWVTSAGTSQTPAALVTAPPAEILDAQLMDVVFPPGARVGNMFMLVQGERLVAFDWTRATIATGPAAAR